MVFSIYNNFFKMNKTIIIMHIYIKLLMMINYPNTLRDDDYMVVGCCQQQRIQLHAFFNLKTHYHVVIVSQGITVKDIFKDINRKVQANSNSESYKNFRRPYKYIYTSNIPIYGFFFLLDNFFFESKSLCEYNIR